MNSHILASFRGLTVPIVGLIISCRRPWGPGGKPSMSKVKLVQRGYLFQEVTVTYQGVEAIGKVTLPPGTPSLSAGQKITGAFSIECRTYRGQIPRGYVEFIPGVVKGTGTMDDLHAALELSQ